MHRRLMVMMVQGMVLAGGLPLAFDSPARAGDEMIDRAAPKPALGDSWKVTGSSVAQESTMHISLALRGPIQVRDCAREEL